MAEAANEMDGTKSSSQAAALSGSPSGCWVYVLCVPQLQMAPELPWGSPWGAACFAGALKEAMLWRLMLLTCAGCNTSISESGGDISFFSILVGKIHKGQTYLACFAHVGGPLTSQQWELVARYLLPGLSIKYFSSGTSCVYLTVLFEDLYNVRILFTLPRQILEQDLQVCFLSPPFWCLCLISMSEPAT